MCARTFRSNLLICVILICGLATKVLCHNVDIHRAVIFQSTTDGPDSLFGTTVRLMKSETTSWLMVGSPQANSSFPNHRSISEPGVLWRCSLENNPSCENVVMDPTGNVEDPIHKVVDHKDSGWFGGAMTEGESSKFVSCASRWVNERTSESTNAYVMNGICYSTKFSSLLTQTIDSELLPTSRRLLPLITDDSSSQTSNVYNFGQAGFSVHAAKDVNDIVIGAPGVNSWRGSVIRYFDDDSVSPIDGESIQQMYIMRPDSSKIKMSHSSYFGYNVNSGKFLTANQQVQYVAGAPRGNDLKGSVIIFSFPENSENSWEFIQELKGDQIGSYFGSVLCVVDINGDGFDDLLVGAPRQSTKASGQMKEAPGVRPRLVLSRTRQKFIGNGDEGHVFVYMGSGHQLKKSTESLMGENVPWSQFGSAIASLGDINGDGFNDVAIGAPYQNEGSGVVFIYHGSETGIKKLFSQVVKANSIDYSLKGFGYSLSLGVDVDNNGYNDIVVGSYDTAQTVVLRTVPFVKVSGKTKFILNSAEIGKIPLNTTEFEIESCISFQGIYLPEMLDFKVKISADVEERKPRISLHIDGQTDNHEHNYEEQVYEHKEACTKFQAKVLERLSISSKPVVIRQEISLPRTETTTNTIYQITESAGRVVVVKNKGPGYDAFCKNCPTLNPDFPNSFINRLPLSVPCGEDNVCMADLQLDARFTDIVNGTFIVGSNNSIFLNISLTNKGEIAYTPSLNITWTRRTLKNNPAACVVTNEQEITYNAKCTFEHLETNQTLNLVLEFDMSKLNTREGDKGSSHEFWTIIEAKTDSEMEKPVVANLLLEISRRAHLTMKGSDKIEIYNPTSTKPVIDISQNFELSLVGPSSTRDVSLTVRIPTGLKASADPFIRLTDSKVYGVSGESPYSCTNSADPDSDAVMMQPSTSEKGSKLESRNLKKRDVSNEEVPNERPRSRKFNSNKKLQFNCDSGLVQCTEITCEINHFAKNSKVYLQLKMEIRTDDYRQLLSQQKPAEEVEIKSKATITRAGEEKGIQVIDYVREAVTTVTLESAKSIPKWMIGLAVVAGLFILFLIIFCLWMAGCLEKSKKPSEEKLPEEMPLHVSGDPRTTDTIREENEETESTYDDANNEVDNNRR